MEEIIRKLVEAYINNSCKYELHLELSTRGTDIMLWVNNWDDNEINKSTYFSVNNLMDDHEKEENMKLMIDIMKGVVDPFDENLEKVL